MAQMSASDIDVLLRSLRCQALGNGGDKLSTAQLDAHWSLAYACKQPPEPWEVYRVPALHLMPSTEFFCNHTVEIQEALKPELSWELLRVHAVEKIALDASLTEKECKAHGYPGNVQYYDFTANRWASVAVPRVRWFDGRELTRDTVARTKDEFRATVDARLAKLKTKAAADPSPKRLDELAAYEKYVVGQFQTNLKKFEVDKAAARVWLAKIDATRDFGKALFTLLRETENKVRAARGIAAIGEAWVSETELLYRVREIVPNVEVIAHGQPKWLGAVRISVCET